MTVDELAIVITIDFDGNIHLEATVLKETIKRLLEQGETVDVDIPLPRSIAAKVGAAISEAAEASIPRSGTAASH